MTARRDLAVAVAIWAVLSAIGVVVVLGTQILPVIASREAEVVNGAFVMLTVASVPILMLVVVPSAYSAIRFRASDDDETDGPPIHGHRAFEAGWVVVSLVLVIGLAAFGTIGLLEIRGGPDADLEVRAESTQWAWEFAYPDLGVRSKELVLPVDRRVRITIVSDDVLHSFYVPAFGIKQDAVPGRVTYLHVTPTVTGTYGAQCAELCGLGHTKMVAGVAVLELSEFEAWVAEQQPQQP
ncbi:MAG: cytochrome C oxidase subunit II, cytochrome c oxidase subunit II [Chloroflexi bacterium CSP1-4]|nr:MAG: cytochrome C oxidase subunit II, cytochrome c oxidase subunit II [Chloroflexi bacterium CSP1-4]